MQRNPRWKPLLVAPIVLALAACGTSPTADVTGLRPIVGGALPGSKGLTTDDQHQIDDTVARLCAAGIYTRAECAQHSTASAERFGKEPK